MEPDSYLVKSNPTLAIAKKTKKERERGPKKEKTYPHLLCCLCFGVNKPDSFYGGGPHTPPTWTICNLFVPYLVLDEWGGSPFALVFSLSLSQVLSLRLPFSTFQLPLVFFPLFFSFYLNGRPSVSRVFDVIFRYDVQLATRRRFVDDKGDNSPNAYSGLQLLLLRRLLLRLILEWIGIWT